MNNMEYTLVSEMDVKGFFKNPPIRQGLMGVYVLENGCGQRYIGSSIDLKFRLAYHRINRLYGPIKFVTLYFANNEREARLLEYNMIHKIRPDLNSIESLNVVEHNSRKISIITKNEE